MWKAGWRERKRSRGAEAGWRTLRRRTAGGIRDLLGSDGSGQGTTRQLAEIRNSERGASWRRWLRLWSIPGLTEAQIS